MADFIAAFHIDDATILYRLHLAAKEAAQKAGGKDLVVTNSGVTDTKVPSKNFKNDNNKYYVFSRIEKNLKVFDGAAQFLVDNHYLGMSDKDLAKKIGKNAFSKSNSSNMNVLKDLKKSCFDAFKAYFSTFAGKQQASNVSEDDMVLVIDGSKLPFGDNGKALNEDSHIGFKIGYTVGLGANS